MQVEVSRIIKLHSGSSGLSVVKFIVLMICFDTKLIEQILTCRAQTSGLSCVRDVPLQCCSSQFWLMSRIPMNGTLLCRQVVYARRGDVRVGVANCLVPRNRSYTRHCNGHQLGSQSPADMALGRVFRRRGVKSQGYSSHTGSHEAPPIMLT